MSGRKLPGKLTLYHSAPFRSLRCAWLIEELDATGDVTFVKIGLHGGTTPEEIAAYRTDVHPHGTLPAMQVEGGLTILESGAICMYLADLYGKLAPPPAERNEYYHWIMYACSTVDGFMEPLYMQLSHVPEEKRNHQLIEQSRAKFHIFAKYLSQVLENREYICGDTFTAADCVMGYNVYWMSAIERGALLNQYPTIKAYGERLSQRPAHQKVFKRK